MRRGFRWVGEGPYAWPPRSVATISPLPALRSDERGQCEWRGADLDGMSEFIARSL